jgi:hypothetical protein
MIELSRAGALTTANPQLAEEYGSVEWSKSHLTESVERVSCDTLDSILRDHAIRPGFNLLVVDVEGYESQVFSGFSLDYWRPQMLIVELADLHPDLASTATQDAYLLRQIVRSGYQIVYKDHINTVFLDDPVWVAHYGLEPSVGQPP